MVAALAIFGGVINRRAIDLDLAGRQRTLQIRRVLIRIPQAEFDIRKHTHRARKLTQIAQCELMDLGIETEWHEKEHFGEQIAPLAGDARVAEPMAAFVEIEIVFDRQIRRAPYLAALAQIKVAAAGVGGRMIAIAQDAPQARVAIKTVTAAGVRHDREET